MSFETNKSCVIEVSIELCTDAEEYEIKAFGCPQWMFDAIESASDGDGAQSWAANIHQNSQEADAADRGGCQSFHEGNEQ